LGTVHECCNFGGWVVFLARQAIAAEGWHVIIDGCGDLTTYGLVNAILCGVFD
jgi:hypothetical protein